MAESSRFHADLIIRLIRKGRKAFSRRGDKRYFRRVMRQREQSVFAAALHEHVLAYDLQQRELGEGKLCRKCHDPIYGVLRHDLNWEVMRWGCYSVNTDEVSPAAVSTTSAPAQSALPRSYLVRGRGRLPNPMPSTLPPSVHATRKHRFSTNSSSCLQCSPQDSSSPTPCVDNTGFLLQPPVQVSHNIPAAEPLVSLRGGANPASSSKAEICVRRNTTLSLYEPSAADLRQKKLEVRPRVYQVVPQHYAQLPRHIRERLPTSMQALATNGQSSP